ncbi:glycosyltransferase family 20 protein [Hydnomerulius pinastri MD-312]|uniref:Glycosyltransferase family 20 protein n=1 Tax=Hydnomerulius pinastri MD-312 TaxID=994086 RepID=A0A0C9V3L9_9AGAM|nr:glycosyltransferase family 20 protein [Hydnomerulius pinastri MD-312]
MDTFNEPYTRAGDDISLDAVREHVRSLEQSHKANGVPLSGRIIHVCHQLPIAPTLISPAGAQGVGSPVGNRWKLAPRYGHAAMISGIRSLSATHDQLIIGWTGDILSPPSSTSPDEDTIIPSHLVSQADRDALEAELVGYDDDGKVDGAQGKIDYVPVWLEDKVAHGHYDGYCKTSDVLIGTSPCPFLSFACPQTPLWPLFHYLLWQDVATEYASADAHYEHYEQANQAFASRIASVLRPGDLVWVHDYHLLLVPKLLRGAVGEGAGDVIIGLFVHTPFPSSEVFRCLPRRKEILEGMLGANLVCFQTYSYSRHFTSTCVRVCGYETTSRTKYIAIDVAGHTVSVSHCPVGIDAVRVARDVLRPGVRPGLEALGALYADKKIVVGRDKLDVVKGVLQKLRAFEKLLHDYPEWRGQVVLIQVTSPALSDSPKLERQVSELVAHINGEYGSLDFIPVHHYHQTLKKDEFYALLSVADLGVITPLRDGMNTTSMEFVIAQERTKKSPLVLSEFMGISQHMGEALQVNPWDLGDVAAAMNTGLLMSPTSKAARHAALHKVVTTHTSHTWAAVLVKMLLSQINGQTAARGTPYIEREKLRERYESAGKRLFLFDYDGTLTPIVKTPSMAVPSVDTLTALSKLTSDPKNIVYIVSGRDQQFLETHLGHIKSLGMSAEHGGFIREPASGDEKEGGEGEDWVNFTEQLDMGWMEEVAEIFRYYTERTTGSHIEVKKSSITWHYRSSDPEWGLFQCRQCQDLLENNLAHKRPIEVLVGKKNLEVRPIAVNKGEIVKRILYLNPDAEFIFCAGDDKTDEDMFRALHLFPRTPTSPLSLEAPLSVTLVSPSASPAPPAPEVELAVQPDAIFTTAVGPASKRTLASWHVTTPEEVVEHMLYLVGEPSSGGAGDEEGKSYL